MAVRLSFFQVADAIVLGGFCCALETMVAAFVESWLPLLRLVRFCKKKQGILQPVFLTHTFHSQRNYRK